MKLMKIVVLSTIVSLYGMSLFGTRVSRQLKSRQNIEKQQQDNIATLQKLEDDAKAKLVMMKRQAPAVKSDITLEEAAATQGWFDWAADWAKASLGLATSLASTAYGYVPSAASLQSVFGPMFGFTADALTKINEPLEKIRVTLYGKLKEQMPDTLATVFSCVLTYVVVALVVWGGYESAKAAISYLYTTVKVSRGGAVIDDSLRLIADQDLAQQLPNRFDIPLAEIHDRRVGG